MHYDAVREVAWVPMSAVAADAATTTTATIPDDVRCWRLLTFGADGKVLLWEVDERNKALAPVRGVQLLLSDMHASAVPLPVDGMVEMEEHTLHML